MHFVLSYLKRPILSEANAAINSEGRTTYLPATLAFMSLLSDLQLSPQEEWNFWELVTHKRSKKICVFWGEKRPANKKLLHYRYFFWNCVFIPEKLFQFWKEEKKNSNLKISPFLTGSSSKNTMAQYVLAAHVVIQLCLWAHLNVLVMFLHVTF